MNYNFDLWVEFLANGDRKLATLSPEGLVEDKVSVFNGVKMVIGYVIIREAVEQKLRELFPEAILVYAQMISNQLKSDDDETGMIRGNRSKQFEMLNENGEWEVIHIDRKGEENVSNS